MMKNGILAVVIGFFAFFAACSDDDHNGEENPPESRLLKRFSGKIRDGLECGMEDG